MQVKVHYADARRAINDFVPAQSLIAQMALLVLVQVVMLADVFVRDQEKPASAAGGIVDRLSWSRPHDIDDSANQSAWREILPRTGFHIFRVLFEQALVGIALHVHIEYGPLFPVNQVCDKAMKKGGILNLVLRFAEDRAKHAPFAA